jgi:hypothetical protein
MVRAFAMLSPDDRDTIAAALDMLADARELSSRALVASAHRVGTDDDRHAMLQRLATADCAAMVAARELAAGARGEVDVIA